jgi:hypothetical protein
MIRMTEPVMYCLLAIAMLFGGWLMGMFGSDFGADSPSQFLGFLMTLAATFGYTFLARRGLQQEASSMNQNQIEEWKRIRDKGKYRYTIRGVVFSILLLNVPYIVIEAAKAYLTGESYRSIWIGNFRFHIIFVIIIASLAYLWSLKMWKFHEENYQRSSQPPPSN